MVEETRRSFWKHRVQGAVFCVEVDETGQVLAARPVSEASTCRHQRDELELTADEAKHLNRDRREYEPIGLGCSDPKHWLVDLGEAEKACAEAERAFKVAHSDAKAKKEILEQREAELRRLVREAVSPKELPLFGTSAA